MVDRGKSLYHTQNEPTGEVTQHTDGPVPFLVAAFFYLIMV